MIKIQNILSQYSALPLAQIRTDENKIEWINDVGGLQKLVGDTYSDLLAFVDSHQHLDLKDTDKPVTMQNITLSNGDTISITNDGRTAFLNGKLLNASQKTNLQQMLDSGALSVTGQGAPQIFVAKPEHPQQSSIDKANARKAEFAQMKQEEEKAKGKDNVYHDSELEKIDDHIVKNLAYYSKYGQFKGGKDA